MRGVFGTAKGLACTVTDSRSHTLTFVLSQGFGKALTLREALACAVGFSGTCAKGFTDGLANRVTDRLTDRVCNGRRKAFPRGIGYGISIRIGVAPTLTCTQICHIHHRDTDGEVHRGHTLELFIPSGHFTGSLGKPTFQMLRFYRA